jgi:acetyl esterase/lipase
MIQWGVSMRRYLASVFVFAVLAGTTFGGEPAYNKVVDVPYLGDADTSEYAQKQCRLDLYYPKDKQNYPTLVWFHGGGLSGGNRKSGEALAKRFASEGVAVVLAGYRLSPKVKNPVWTEDAAAAVAWTIKNIGKHKGDPEKVFVGGHSAGGYLTGILGLDKKWLAKHDIPLGKLAGFIPLAGQMVTHSTIRKENGKDKPYIDEFAPIYHASAAGAPWLVIVGDKDSADRIKESEDFVAALKKAGHKHVELDIVKGRNHGSIGGKFADPDDVVALRMLEFIMKAKK